MTTFLRSRDVNSDMLVDKLSGSDSQIYIHKFKVVFGPDGAYLDVTEANPFPVAGTFTVTPGPFPYPPGADAFVASYPNPVTVVYTYKSGGTGGTTLATLTVIYTDASQKTILSGAWT